MPDGWKVKSQVDIRYRDGTRVLKPVEELTAADRVRMHENQKRYLRAAGFEVVEEGELPMAAGGEA